MADGSTVRDTVAGLLGGASLVFSPGGAGLPPSNPSIDVAPPVSQVQLIEQGFLGGDLAHPAVDLDQLADQDQTALDIAADNADAEAQDLPPVDLAEAAPDLAPVPEVPGDLAGPDLAPEVMGDAAMDAPAAGPVGG